MLFKADWKDLCLGGSFALIEHFSHTLSSLEDARKAEDLIAPIFFQPAPTQDVIFCAFKFVVFALPLHVSDAVSIV